MTRASPEGRLLVLGDYPVGYANGIGETLSSLLADHPDELLLQSHPDHLRPLDRQGRGRAATFHVPPVTVATRPGRRRTPPAEYLRTGVADTVCRIVLGAREPDLAEREWQAKVGP